MNNREHLLAYKRWHFWFLDYSNEGTLIAAINSDGMLWIPSIIRVLCHPWLTVKAIYTWWRLQ